MEQTEDPLVSLEINSIVTHLKESEVPPPLKKFIKHVNPSSSQDNTPTLQQSADSSPSTAEASNTATSTVTSSTEPKGKTKAPDFTKVLKKTSFAAATPLDNIKGTNQEKISILDRFFVSNEAYAGAKVSHYKGKHLLLAFFDIQKSAMQICNKQIKALDNMIFIS